MLIWTVLFCVTKTSDSKGDRISLLAVYLFGRVSVSGHLASYPKTTNPLIVLKLGQNAKQSKECNGLLLFQQ